MPADPAPERRFPLQIDGHDRKLEIEAKREGRKMKGLRSSVPWCVGEMAWATYDKLYRCGQSAERIAERGGFSNAEMDEFLPDWRELSDAG